MDCFKDLVQYYDIITPADWKQIAGISTRRYFEKGDILIQEGELAEVCAFVLKGSFKNISYSTDGKERILKFSSECDFLASCESYNTQTPSGFSIVAMKRSEALVINNDDLFELCHINTAIAGLGGILSQQMLQQHEEHLKLLSLNSPFQRYKYVLENHPHLLSKVSLTDLSKYIFTSREAVSRARRQLLQEST